MNKTTKLIASIQEELIGRQNKEPLEHILKYAKVTYPSLPEYVTRVAQLKGLRKTLSPSIYLETAHDIILCTPDHALRYWIHTDESYLGIPLQIVISNDEPFFKSSVMRPIIAQYLYEYKVCFKCARALDHVTTLKELKQVLDYYGNPLDEFNCWPTPASTNTKEETK